MFSWKNCNIRKTNNWILHASLPKSKLNYSNTLNNSNTTVDTCKKNCYKYLDSIDQPFINKMDLLIQLSSYDSNTDSVGNHLMRALKEPVITPEV